MVPDTTNTYGIAALWVSTDGAAQHGTNFVLYTDGTGETCTNHAGADWVAWDALPTSDVTTLNEGTGAYETVRTLDVDIADVAEWSPWTIYMADGTWYTRDNAFSPWQEATAAQVTTGTDILPPRKPTNFDDPPA
jgi:hypothetical protein